MDQIQYARFFAGCASLTVLLVRTGLCQDDLKGTQYMLDKNVNPGQVIEQLPPPQGGVEGTTYLFEHWYNGDIYLKNGKQIRNYPIKVDLYNAILEVKGGDMVRICTFEKIDQLKLYDPFENDTLLFVQAGRYSFSNETPLSGLLQIIHRGKTMVFAYPSTEIREATYVPAIDMGSRNEKIVIHREYYFLGEAGTVVPIAHSRKGNLHFFGDKAGEMNNYIRKNKLRFTDEDDLVTIFSHYDGLI